MASGPYLTAREAAEALGISLPTLYAYVSRGLVRSEAAGGSARSRRYHAEDIQRLKERQQQRRDPGKMVEGALHWGMPVMESAITLLADGTFYYRGHDALALASTHSVEQVAALIWTGDASADAVARLFGPATGTLPPACAALRPHLPALAASDAFRMLLPLAAVDDVAAYDLRPEAVAQTGARILRLLVAIAVGEQPGAAGIAQALQLGWAPHASRAAAVLNAALILCADHELNVTSFTARCVASAGATPYDVVAAGLCALSGARHAGRSARIEAFLRQVGAPNSAHAAIAGRLKRGEEIPGFGHPLYPGGDPRARALLQRTAIAFPESPAVALADAVVQEARGLLGEHPDVEFGLVTLAAALGLPPGGAISLFALSRTIGWIGHAIEEYQANRVIRPRARYVGEQPRDHVPRA